MHPTEAGKVNKRSPLLNVARRQGVVVTLGARGRKARY